MYSLRSKIRWLAIYSRGFVLVLQIMAYHTLPQLPASDEKFHWRPLNNDIDDAEHASSSGTLADQLLTESLSGLIRGDAHQHLMVADRGYVFEHALAFFPAYPLAVRGFAAAADWALNASSGLRLLSRASLLRLSGFYISAVCFVLAADLLYSLSRRVLRDEALAYRAALLFCLNPASVAFSSPSADALFAATSFAAMLALEKRGLDTFTAIALFTVSSVAGGGLALAGFAVYHSMKTVATETILFIRSKKKSSTNRNSPSASTKPADVLVTVSTRAVVPGCCNVIASAAPFLAFQWYAFRAFCETGEVEFELEQSDVETAKQMGFKTPGNTNKSSWCLDDPPVPYVHVRSIYWGIGFLKYWQPQFMLQMLSAAPAAGREDTRCLIVVERLKKL